MPLTTPPTEEELLERRRLVNRDSQRRFRQRRQQRNPTHVHEWYGSDDGRSIIVPTAKQDVDVQGGIDSTAPAAFSSSLQFADWHNSAMGLLDNHRTIPLHSETMLQGNPSTASEEALMLSPAQSATDVRTSIMPLETRHHSESCALAAGQYALSPQQNSPHVIHNDTPGQSRSQRQNLFEQKINDLLDELTKIYEVGVSMSFLMPDLTWKSSMDSIRRKVEELSTDGL